MTHCLSGDNYRSVGSFFGRCGFRRAVRCRRDDGNNHIRLIINSSRGRGNVFFGHGKVSIPMPFTRRSLNGRGLLHVLPSFLDIVRGNNVLLVSRFSDNFRGRLRGLVMQCFVRGTGRTRVLFMSRSAGLLDGSVLHPSRRCSMRFRHRRNDSIGHFSSRRPHSTRGVRGVCIDKIFNKLPRCGRMSGRSRWERAR